ncbi:MAG TPA: hypothetical protein VMA98_06715 [Candidatus Acidoferrales bacterium]|nr:hypothetical protein [Candidatus Acidoferrales bacterium]
MPKRILLIAFAVTALALAACNSGYNVNDLYGTPAPSTTPSTPTPNPSASTAIVSVYVGSTPLPNQPVNLSTDVNGSAGTLITTQTTDSTGTTTFSGLTPEANYCFTTSYTPAGGLPQSGSQCGYLWFDGLVFSFSTPSPSLRHR